MRKGEIACYKQFLLFSQCFPQRYIFSVLKRHCVAMSKQPCRERLLLCSKSLNLPIFPTIFKYNMGKGENAGNLYFLHFPQSLYPVTEKLMFCVTMNFPTGNALNNKI